MNNKLKIAVLEPFKGSGDYATVPIDKYWLPDTHYEYKKGQDHADHVCQQFINTINEQSPEYNERYELRLYPNNATGFINAKRDGCLIVNMSQLDWRHNNFITIRYEKELAEQAIMFNGVGNDGRNKESEASKRGDIWLSVGAVDKNGNPRSYSAYGNYLVDVVGIDGQYGWNGTSFASPYCAALTTIYYIKHYDIMGYYPNPEVAKKWVKFNAHDVYILGEDAKTRYGLVMLPRVWEFEDIYVDLDNLSQIVKRRYIDGAMTEETVDTLIDIKNIDGRLMFGARDLASALRGKVYYDANNRRSYFES